MKRKEAIEHVKNLIGYAGLRKVAIQVRMALVLKLEVPKAKKKNGNALVKYFVGDLFEAAGLSEDEIKARIDENFFKKEEQRLLELVRDLPPGAVRENYKVELVELRKRHEETGDDSEVEETEDDDQPGDDQPDDDQSDDEQTDDEQTDDEPLEV